MNERRDPRQAELFAADDQWARERALDIRRSFLVQAPAGSGKTELLIQRCLALLATVDEPERIVALTFTRKAAGEMRERVLGALIEARNERPVAAAHEQRTRELANDVLRHDARRGWNLVTHASRLRIETFDALVVGLARRAPLAAGLGPFPAYVDDARPLYRAAAKAALAAAPADDPLWRDLLIHLDNDAARAESLIADLLQRRAEWLRLVDADVDAMRRAMEDALRAEVRDVLDRIRRRFPPGVAETVANCARHATRVLERIEGKEARAAIFARLTGMTALPAAHADALPQWQALREFLLTAKGTFKAGFSTNDGFLPKGKGGARNDACKEAVKDLCRELEAIPGLASGLAAAARLPSPPVDEAAWRIVVALLHALLSAVDELGRVFRASGQVDFTQGSLAAMQALGTEDEPSDLLLRIDARIDHLLVDEFQDTSLAQLDLLTRLTEGWQPGDGRTLFAVGDPMQSIYRFREAEVRLFVDAQTRGRIASVPVEALYLRCNFRSQRGLVDWVNAKFPGVLGSVNDAARGAVAFASATPACEPCGDLVPTVDLATSAEDEAAIVIARIQESRAARARKIAVLVRARPHLLALLPALRRAEVPFAAVELDHLSERQAIRDLAALTHALLQPADRTAWLAVLRAPWCGLPLGDLLTLAEATDRSAHRALPLVYEDEAVLGSLSGEGRERLVGALDVLRPALASRGRATVAARVRGAWLALGGPACLNEPLDLETTESFFALLAEHEHGGDVADWEAFLIALAELPSSPATPGEAGVQVMTMHKAKGLEFDTVILPGLGAGAGGDDAWLMRYRRRDAGLLIAPGKARGGANDPVYEYLSELDKDERDAELGRLLYVACTRAKTRLHLIAVPKTRPVKGTDARQWSPVPSSSLAKLWPVLDIDRPPPSEPVVSSAEAIPPSPLLRLPRDCAFPAVREPLATLPLAARGDAISPSFEWAAEAARQIGTLAHRLLAQLASEGLASWTEQRIASLAPRVRAGLASAGFAERELPSACTRVLAAIRRTLADPRGRWLFDPRHEDARSEWSLAGLDGGSIVHVVLDRTFVENGIRWIIDYKTGVHEGGELAAFLDREIGRYRDQLLRYGRLMRALDPRPVRLALYYPLVDGGFREVPTDEPL